jgi:site-specific DNA-methyltransferase (adenine-specific)
MIDLNEKPLCTIPSVMCWAVDNLELLKSQPDESVDLIYCDILYGTGRNFVDYQDLKPKQDVIESHYLPRLIEMKRVLKQNGTIYLQMDTRINHWMRILMDKVFGYDNFRNEIVWFYNSQGKTNKQWNKKHDVILFYSNSSNWTFNANDVKDSITDLTYKRFKKEIEKKGYYTSFKNGKEYKYYPENGSLPKDWIEDITYISRDNKELTGYPTQKPKELIRRFVLASSNEGDTVADYYMGSGTTAEVCKELNRNFIGCDINPKAIEITKTRLNSVS